MKEGDRPCRDEERQREEKENPKSGTYCGAAKSEPGGEDIRLAIPFCSTVQKNSESESAFHQLP